MIKSLSGFLTHSVHIVGMLRRNAASSRACQPLGAWTVGAPATGRMGVPPADTARRASTVMSLKGNTCLDASSQ